MRSTCWSVRRHLSDEASATSQKCRSPLDASAAANRGLWDGWTAALGPDDDASGVTVQGTLTGVQAARSALRLPDPKLEVREGLLPIHTVVLEVLQVVFGAVGVAVVQKLRERATIVCVGADSAVA